MIGWRARVHQQCDSALSVTCRTNRGNSGTRRSPGGNPSQQPTRTRQRFHAIATIPEEKGCNTRLDSCRRAGRGSWLTGSAECLSPFGGTGRLPVWTGQDHKRHQRGASQNADDDADPPSPVPTGHPSVSNAVAQIWSSYGGDAAALWAWDNGDLPIWMTFDAIEALRLASLAVPARPGWSPPLWQSARRAGKCPDWRPEETGAVRIRLGNRDGNAGRRDGRE